jgi:hypothetical protein
MTTCVRSEGQAWQRVEHGIEEKKFGGYTSPAE